MILDYVEKAWDLGEDVYYCLREKAYFIADIVDDVLASDGDFSKRIMDTYRTKRDAYISALNSLL